MSVSPEMMSIGGAARQIVIATTKSFALKIIHNNEEKCYNMIVKNEPMNNGFVDVSKVFGTLYYDQGSVNIEIYENDYMDEYFNVDDDLKIGEAILELPARLPEGAPIEVTLKLNKEGILDVKGVDKTGNREVNVRMETKGVMSEEELEKIKRRSQGIVVL